MKKKLVVGVFSPIPYWNFPDEWVDAIRRKFRRQLEVIQVKSRENLLREVADADWLCAYRIDAEVVSRAEKLRWLHCPAAGVASLLIPEVLESDMVVTNSSGANSTMVAEQVVGYMLMFARRLHDAVRYQQKAKWASDLIWYSRPPLGQLAGKTVGIVGLGAIGREVARLAGAFRMRVVATKRDISAVKKNVDLLLPPHRLPLLLREADYVVLSLPLTKEHRGLMGARELNLMKPGAFLVNVARGSLVDEAALVAALQDNRIAGAALDVFIQEPLPRKSPLWRLPNVIITPHNAGSSGDYWDRVTVFFMENIQRRLKDKRLRNVVDKRLGY